MGQLFIYLRVCITINLRLHDCIRRPCGLRNANSKLPVRHTIAMFGVDGLPVTPHACGKSSGSSGKWFSRWKLSWWDRRRWSTAIVDSSCDNLIICVLQQEADGTCDEAVDFWPVCLFGSILELCQFRLTDFVIERSCRMSCLLFGTDFYGCKLVMPAYRELLQRSSDYSSFLTSSEFE